MSEAERMVAEAAERGVVLTLTARELHPQRVLELLAESGRSHRVTIESSLGAITVELGNGLVVGAEAELAGTKLTGRQAYATIRDVDGAAVRIEPLRFPSLANILQPVAQLPDLERTATLPPAAGDDTIELTLPEARPVHPPPMPEETTVVEPRTIEMELPADAEELEVSPRPVPPPVPAPVMVAPALPATREHVLEAPASRARGLKIAVAAAAVLLLVGGATGLLLPSSGEAARVSAAVPVPVTAEAPDREVGVDLDLSDEAPAVSDDLAEARALARTSRQLLRDGDRAAALATARRAAALRGGMPYYQVLLGDALRANGQRAAARRAYQRAVRLRPGYGPAVRRLQRGRGRAASPTSQT